MRGAAIQQWLESYCHQTKDVVGGVVMLAQPRDGALVLAAQWPRHASQDAKLIGAARALVEPKSAERQNLPGAPSEHPSPNPRVLSLRLRSGNRALGAIALELQSGDAEARRRAATALERTASTIAAALAPSQSPVRIDAARTLQLQATILSHEKFDAAATAFATELAITLQMDRVAVGIVENGQIRVAALSRSADFETKADVLRTLGDAMQEAIEQGSTVAFPASTDDRPRVTLAHAALVKRQGGSVCTIPMACAGRAIGAVTLERLGEAPLGKAELLAGEQMAGMAAPILELKWRAERRWHARLADAARAAVERLRQPGHAAAKFAALATTVALAALLFVPAEFRVSAPARVEGSVQRSLVAPADGFLRRVHVRPGDAVTAGQVLVELADEDLLLERRKWESELSQHETAAPAALSRADRAQFVISEAKADEARAQLGLIDSQLNRGRIRAPFDGVVIKGDLHQALGAPVQRGEVLLTVAPAEGYRVIVEVDERDIAAIHPGQSGALALAALAQGSLPLTVMRVTPAAESRDGRNFFEVETSLEASAPALRAGQLGVAKIRAGERPLAQIWTRRFVDWLRLTMWSLGA